MFAEPHLLSLTIWTPILGGLLVLLIGDRNVPAARWCALAVALLAFAISLGLWTGFDSTNPGMQFVEQARWIPTFNADYHLGVDGISMPMIILTAFMTIFVVVAGWEVVTQRPSQYLGAFLIMEGIMIGAFAALDAVLFYVFWEAMLIPMFLIIGIWGGPRRVYATIKFFLFTFFGSVLMLVAFIYLYQKSGTFDVLALQQLPLSGAEQTWIFLAFLVAFAVKVPMWPVHTWLPDAHVEAPTGGSVILAAITLKLGTYGFLRYSMPIAPDASLEMSGLLVALSLIAVVYIGLVALVQQDMKKLIAYSSIAHMGFVTLGFFIPFFIVEATGSRAGSAMAMQGGVVQMVSHGFISGAMFLCVGVLYDRMHSRQIADYGGVVNTMPNFAAFMVLFAMANAGLPGTSGFVGEFMVILASFRASFWIAALAALTLILGAAYTLWMVKRVIFGAVQNDRVQALDDINGREFLMLAVLAVAVLALGLWPAPLIDVMAPSIDQLLAHVLQGKG
ncbi:MAG: NADH-quinone oxidoreductase subunit M [Pseudomonadota bacterium]|nr:NADH-quinone oxidoreductase subunit M [Pseudomonadota bacterium]